MFDDRLEQELRLLHKRVCSALGDPKRMLVLYALTDRPLCVNELVEALHAPQSTVSHHLGMLRERGLVRTERRGTAVYYHLADRRMIEALDLMRPVLAAQLAAESGMTQAAA